MPGPSPWPLLAAVFTAGFFLLLTVQAYGIGFVSGVIAILCVLRWLWDTDRVVKEEKVDVGGGILLPTYVTGPRSHGWWAMVILLIVIGMIFVMGLFSFFYLYGVQPDFWTAPAGWEGAAVVVPLYALAAGLAWLARFMLAREATQLWTPGVLYLCAAIALTAAVGGDILFWQASGLMPQDSGQGATIYVLLALEAMLAGIALLMAAYLSARNSRAMIVRPRNNSMDLCVLFLLYAAAQGALTAIVTRAFGG